MGQPVAVVEKSSANPGIVRFEANRNLTGMGHERFRSAADAVGPRPAAVLARRLFESGRVGGVHIYGNIITVDLRKGFDAEGLKEIVEDLYLYYRPGFVPPSWEEKYGVQAAAAEAPAPAAGGDAGPAVDSRVPAHLLERSRAAKAKWSAKQAG